MLRLFAPPAPDTERRGLFVRLLSGTLLFLLAALMLIGTVSLSYVRYYSVDPVATPVEVYHNTWRAVRDNLYDKSKLQGFEEWEHKYDHLIETEEDAIRYSDMMVRSVGEGYTALLPSLTVKRDMRSAEGRFVGIGVELDRTAKTGAPVLSRVLRGGPAEAAGLLEGDALLEIDGSSDAVASVESAARALSGEAGESVNVTVRRDTQILTVSVRRAWVETPVVDYRKLPDGSGYIRIDSFHQWSTSKQVREAMEALSDCRALIVDVRDNPGGFIHEAVATASFFIEEGTVATTISRIPGMGYVTTEVHLASDQLILNTSVFSISRAPVPLFSRSPYLLNRRPVVVLVNGGTASAAEMFTAALAENGVATVVGGKTFGKGIGQIYVPVGNGHRLRVTHLKSFTPKGNWLGDAGQTTSNGVVPDVEIDGGSYSSRGSQMDRQFNKALELLR